MIETEEQQECLYCHGDKKIMSGMSNNVSEVEGLVIHISSLGYLTVATMEISTGIAINYCPMCGRKLVHDENE